MCSVEEEKRRRGEERNVRNHYIMYGVLSVRPSVCVCVCVYKRPRLSLTGNRGVTK